ncbi:type II secretion system protein GspF [Ketobacter sp. MCCC 1A13808]|uniref:type II secretion system inner membrane protein GspF n=1 Tax=Ketobacter sp. MCCC 1A13808 TaxID=2602738 RepID=UPI000F102655|nr:type II secretion system inner membrane protein GspF [Ketobacter sp. MCCC 1A13808]MVF10528.1 type II secretion system protein GspF [Ketobacter sp. MCCC 1A13808]RLP55958.1 MAG: type II secretion system protein GspF [Ketobacter sp.]
MPAFEYVVLDARGKQKKGVLEGDSARQVRQQLKEKGLVPLSVDTTSQKQDKDDNGKVSFSRASISAGDLAVVTRQLATLLQAGLPLEEALKAVAKQQEKAKITSVMSAIRSKVVEGHTLASSLSEFPQSFPELYRATVDAGEHSGHLDLVLEQLAEYTEARYRTKKKVQGAMIYPLVLTAFAFLIVAGMLTFVVPKIVSVFADSGQELPTLTKVLIASSELLQNWWWLMAIMATGAFYGFKRALKNEAFKYRFHAWMLRMPLLGKINRGLDASRVASTLSILSRSGVPLVEAMKISGQVAGNVCIRESVVLGADKLKEGSTLFAALDGSGYFPPMMMQMIASGENSGELESMLARAATNQERELEDLIDTIVALFEPLMLVVMGGVVMIIVLSIMMPILSMNSLVG